MTNVQYRSNRSLSRGNDLCLGSRPVELWSRNSELLETIPVMSGTILGLEMVIRRSCIDVSTATEIVSTDIGACIHLLRWVGRKYGYRQGGPTRISECIAIIDIDHFLEVLASRAFASDAPHAGWSQVRETCNGVAKFARMMAESIVGVSPDDAYLVGMLHDRGLVGRVLGWSQDHQDWIRSCGDLLASEGSLPVAITDAFKELKWNDPTGPWNFILSGAHELSDGAIADSSLRPW